MNDDPTHTRHPKRSLGTAPEATEDAPASQPWCPGCSAPLHGRSCKLRCLRCGYFEDCSNLL
jgi:hypothetical protein